jgi:hypothetical protein
MVDVGTTGDTSASIGVEAAVYGELNSRLPLDGVKLLVFQPAE